jgi:hypothetical protein
MLVDEPAEYIDSLHRMIHSGQLDERQPDESEKWQTRDPPACARRRLVQDAPPRRGAGPIRCPRGIRRTEDADTRTPRLRHSPTIRR